MSSTLEQRIAEIDANLTDLKRKQTPVVPFEWEQVNLVKSENLKLKAENERLNDRIMTLEQMLNDRKPVYEHVSSSPKSKAYKKKKSDSAYEQFKAKVFEYMDSNPKTYAYALVTNDSQHKFLHRMLHEDLIYWHSHKIGWRRKGRK